HENHQKSLPVFKSQVKALKISANALRTSLQTTSASPYPLTVIAFVCLIYIHKNMLLADFVSFIYHLKHMSSAACG
ncbi:hypothetical protein AZJ40_03675, partial [Streptococcus pneumoniae]